MFNMENQLLIQYPSGSLETIKRPSKNLIVLGDNLIAINKKYSFDAIRIYEPSARLIICKNQFEEEKKFLTESFFRGFFNIFNYINDSSYSFTNYVRDWKDFDCIFERISNDIDNGYLPFKYGVHLAINTKKARRISGNL